MAHSSANSPRPFDDQTLAELREDYDRPALCEQDMLADPIAQFRDWIDQAHGADILQPNAMTLATVDEAGQPHARVVLLKAVDERGFVFYTNQQSAKAEQLDAAPRAALVFHWEKWARQVRVTGTVAPTSRAETEAYFASRPRQSQLGAWASQQSQVISDREVLDAAMRELEARFDGKSVPPPPHWGGYRVRPATIEFWQGQRSRLHDRLRYRWDGSGWTLERLSP